MVQGGDPNSKNATKDTRLGMGSPGYTIPSEFNTAFIHKKGALAAARFGDDVNPSKASSGSQFYFVQGKTMTDGMLDQIEKQINNSKTGSRLREFISKPENKHYKDEISQYQVTRNKLKLDSLGSVLTQLIDEQYKNDSLFKYTPAQREIYKTIGGTPFLDMNYTVFGEIVEGLDIVDKIATVKTLPGDRPEQDVVIISAIIVKK
jgi:cyclophilin family peptidyl-prolyl cis-trans isomerase